MGGCNKVEKSNIIEFKYVPARVHTIEEMFGAIKQLDNVDDIVVLINDDSGIWIMTVDGSTSERINWMIDRAKLLLHKAD